MSSKLDQSLDSIISSAPKRNGGSGGPIRRNGNNNNNNNNQRGNNNNRSGPVRRERQSRPQPYSRPPSEGQWQHDRHQAAEPAQIVPQVSGGGKKLLGDTVHVSNLDKDVNSDDVKDIFSKIGSVKEAVVNYNQAGQSLGTAQVTFHSGSDAQRALEEYDGAEVDGRAMSLKLVGSVVAAPVVVKKHRVVQQAEAPQRANNHQNERRPHNITNMGRRPQQQQQQQQRRLSGNGGNGGSRPQSRQQTPQRRTNNNNDNNRSNGRSGPKKPLSSAQLDAEMDKYQKQSGTEAAGAGQP